jgi:hypothetical protein
LVALLSLQACAGAAVLVGGVLPPLVGLPPLSLSHSDRLTHQLRAASAIEASNTDRAYKQLKKRTLWGLVAAFEVAAITNFVLDCVFLTGNASAVLSLPCRTRARPTSARPGCSSQGRRLR